MSGIPEHLAPYRQGYGEARFWRKAAHHARSAGREALECALQLYYAARSPHTPAWARATIYGALGYFVSTIDALPDITPIVGYTDDLGVLLAALAAVAAHVTPEVRARARRKVQSWFPEPDEPG